MINKTKVGYSLSLEDLDNNIPFECPIYHYTQLKDFRSVEKLLGANECCIILYENERDGSNITGHWTCLMMSPTSESIFDREVGKRAREGLEFDGRSLVFFDSYGTIPDDEKQFIDVKHQKLIGQLENTLSKLLYESGKHVEYNELPLQALKEGVNTCGRFCLLKILTKDLSLEKFQKFMLTPGINPDSKSVVLTNLLFDGVLSPVDLQKRLVFLIQDLEQ